MASLPSLRKCGPAGWCAEDYEFRNRNSLLRMRGVSSINTQKERRRNAGRGGIAAIPTDHCVHREGGTRPCFSFAREVFVKRAASVFLQAKFHGIVDQNVTQHPISPSSRLVLFPYLIDSNLYLKVKTIRVFFLICL